VRSGGFDEDELRVLFCRDSEFGLVDGGDAIAEGDPLPVDEDHARGGREIGVPEANRRVGKAGSGKQGRAQNLGIGTDRQRIAVARISARQHNEAPCPIRFWEIATAPTRRPAALTGQQPDLKKLELVGAAIVLRMADSGSCAHHLDVARPCPADVARAIFVRDDALANIGDDFHIRMTVPAEAGAWRDLIVVPDHETPRGPFAGLPSDETMKWWRAFSQPLSP
jgi:hypothetical protein